jgi:hypothetical protein
MLRLYEALKSFMGLKAHTELSDTSTRVAEDKSVTSEIESALGEQEPRAAEKSVLVPSKTDEKPTLGTQLQWKQSPEEDIVMTASDWHTQAWLHNVVVDVSTDVVVSTVVVVGWNLVVVGWTFVVVAATVVVDATVVIVGMNFVVDLVTEVVVWAAVVELEATEVEVGSKLRIA